MTQTEVIKELNSRYPTMDKLLETENPFCSYDAINDTYIVGIKSRSKEYNSWMIERDKFMSNIEKSIETGKAFIYLTEYNGKIMTWNINKLIASETDFFWQSRPMPKTTEFDNNNTVDKEVGFLYEKDAKIH